MQQELKKCITTQYYELPLGNDPSGNEVQLYSTKIIFLAQWMLLIAAEQVYFILEQY